MGQQQLLLVILVTIIVGIATVVAINVFGTAAEQAERDAVRQDLLGAAVQAQAIWARPTLMDGSGRDFTHFDEGELLTRLNIPADSDYERDSTPLTNSNGSYTLTRTTDGMVITGAPASGSADIELRLTRNTTTGGWDVEIDGEEEQATTTPE